MTALRKATLVLTLIVVAASFESALAASHVADDRLAVANAELAHHKIYTAHPIKVSYVAITARYAIAVYGDENVGGEDVFRYHAGAWRFVGGGGGAATAQDLVKLYNLQPRVARKLIGDVQNYFRLRH